ncbi:MAG: hypothetical protein AUG74_11430 [Bacteroidetes bacterium 13_1_20CM_4_60_6]|nr:MAG: hypothetical protein AUG74_11430 [Bacteroidetes bacterium 13_1_20CM_4_60_6]
MSGNDLVFRTMRTGQPRDVTLRPFNEIYYDYYNVYWDVLTPAKYVERKAALQEEAHPQITQITQNRRQKAVGSRQKALRSRHRRE